MRCFFIIFNAFIIIFKYESILKKIKIKRELLLNNNTFIKYLQIFNSFPFSIITNHLSDLIRPV